MLREGRKKRSTYCSVGRWRYPLSKRLPCPSTTRLNTTVNTHLPFHHGRPVLWVSDTALSPRMLPRDFCPFAAANYCRGVIYYVDGSALQNMVQHRLNIVRIVPSRVDLDAARTRDDDDCLWCVDSPRRLLPMRSASQSQLPKVVSWDGCCACFTREARIARVPLRCLVSALSPSLNV